MATIGFVTKRADGRYEGELKTLSVRAVIVLGPRYRQGDGGSARLPRALRGHRDRRRLAPHWADLRQGVCQPFDRGAGVGHKTLHANLGRAAGQDDPDVFALIWNPQD